MNTNQSVISSRPRVYTLFDSLSENRGIHECGSLVKTSSTVDRKEYSPDVKRKKTLFDT